ncbi:MAG: rhodanese-like domain-containing protein [Bdellovibrionaceae bacterium]|nr:rhodanese-like domain-containing protein [Pseudobdellovibrionaceae bacterium]
MSEIEGGESQGQVWGAEKEAEMQAQWVRVQRFVVRLVSSFALVGLAACASQPTRVGENESRQLQPATNVPVEVKLDEWTVVLDARPAFDFTLSHIPRAIPIQWSDFTQNEDAARGVLQKDLFALARRLARIGISPDSKVVVVGRGIGGEGEEGRVAWTLAYLGVKDVTAVPLSYFKGPLTSQVGTPPAPVPIWKPAPVDDLLVTREELTNAIAKGGVHRPIPYKNGGPAVRQYKIIDVRSPREYVGKEGLALKRPVPNMDAINISWNEFFDASGRPQPRMLQQLRELGFGEQDRVIVLSERGLRSAAVTMALRDLGIKNVGNSAGGLRELMASTNRKR